AARDEFYRGETAKRIAEFHRAEGGPLALSDLAEFSVEVAPALKTTFGSYEVAACGFWCQGPSLLQMLNLLDGVDLKALGHNSPAYLHRIIETIKLAFADRDAYYGDPHFVKIPDALLSRAYAAARQRLVKERAWPQLPPPGDPDRLDAVRNLEAALPLAGGSHPAPGAETDALDTSYVSVVDEAGNRVSGTPRDPHVDSPGGPGVRLVRAAARLAGLARLGPSERGRPRQAAAPHAGAGHGVHRRPPAHAVRHARRRRAAAGDAPGVPEHHRVRHGSAGRHRGAACRVAQSSRLVLAARGRAGQDGGRAAHSA